MLIWTEPHLCVLDRPAKRDISEATGIASELGWGSDAKIYLIMKTNMRELTMRGLHRHVREHCMLGAWELAAEQLRASLPCQETTDLNQDGHAGFVPADHDHRNMLLDTFLDTTSSTDRWTQTARQLVGHNPLDSFLDTNS